MKKVRRSTYVSNLENFHLLPSLCLWYQTKLYLNLTHFEWLLSGGCFSFSVWNVVVVVQSQCMLISPNYSSSLVCYLPGTSVLSGRIFQILHFKIECITKGWEAVTIKWFGEQKNPGLMMYLTPNFGNIAWNIFKDKATSLFDDLLNDILIKELPRYLFSSTSTCTPEYMG